MKPTDVWPDWSNNLAVARSKTDMALSVGNGYRTGEHCLILENQEIMLRALWVLLNQAEAHADLPDTLNDLEAGKEETQEVLETIIFTIGRDGDEGDRDGWWDLLSHNLAEWAGKRLIQHGLWEREADSAGHWWYRPLTQKERRAKVGAKDGQEGE